MAPLGTSDTFHLLCLPSNRGVDMDINRADPVSSGVTADRMFSRLQRSSTLCCLSQRASRQVSAPCADSSAPTSNVNTCVAMFCSRGIYTLDDLYDAIWDSVALVSEHIHNRTLPVPHLSFVRVHVERWISSSNEISTSNHHCHCVPHCYSFGSSHFQSKM